MARQVSRGEGPTIRATPHGPAPQGNDSKERVGWPTGYHRRRSGHDQGGSLNRPRRPATPNSTPPQKGGSTDETTRPTERLAQSLGAESVPPSATFDQEAIEAEHAEIHGRAQKYLLDMVCRRRVTSRPLPASKLAGTGRSRPGP